MTKANGANLRLAAWVAVGALVATLAVTALLVRPQAAERYGAGDYTLVDTDGNVVTDETFGGRPTMVFFGYTHCPDVCPTTMAEMATWFEALGDAGKGLGAYFVSVDPQRDTAGVLKDYVGWLDGRLVGVTGEATEIEEAITAWHVVAERVPQDDGSYLVNHTASVFLLNARGEFEGTISYGEAKDSAVGKLRRLLSV